MPIEIAQMLGMTIGACAAFELVGSDDLSVEPAQPRDKRVVRASAKPATYHATPQTYERIAIERFL
jgi:hypothetical protein